MTDRVELSATYEFDLGDLDLNDLTVVSMHDSAALPESGASSTFRSSSCCYYQVNTP
ncbi:thiazolylpeptide-type bacteriocin [Streptosporangium sp. NPDC000396]|uniref:thiazolylpeptide-type bacteriocin n=1 Tax=Streptosporangium sp. NPDC000396 TaxID=3366185 RepID=UPI0036D1846A